MTYRFYHPAISFQDNQFTIDNPDLIKQLLRVLRISEGEIIYLFDNSGLEYESKVVSIEKNNICLNLLRKYPGDREPDRRIILYPALLKKDKWEWLLQKVTEVGVSEIIPIVTEFTIVDRLSDSKWERYNKILIEATEQCGGCKIPKLGKPVQFIEAIQSQTLDNSKGFILHPDSEAINLSTYQGNEKEYHLFIGPEGGFSPKEIVEALSSSLTIAHLGKRVLRAETAGIIAVSSILHNP